MAQVNWDTGEVMLWFDNDEGLYANKMSWFANWERKLAKGTWEFEKAEKAVRLYVVPRARKHNPEIDRKAVDCGAIVVAWMGELQEHIEYRNNR